MKVDNILIVLFAIAKLSLVQGFATLRVVNPSFSNIRVKGIAPLTSNTASNYVSLYRRQQDFSALQSKSSDIDGTGVRGPIILSLALLIVVWIFSIPPEFRRAKICTLPVCVENRAACNDCQTTTELREGIIDYYRNGGGIKFDFSIDPATIEKNKQTLEKFGL